MTERIKGKELGPLSRAPPNTQCRCDEGGLQRKRKMSLLIVINSYTELA